MGNENEPAKLLLPYLQRADELQKHEPLVAYYCRLYAMERGLKIPVKERTKTTSALLISLMNQLEKDRKSLKLSAEDNLYVEGFALNVFAKADKQDRAGRADLNTAKTFYAASIFFEILGQFGEIQPDIEQKQKYSVWKAAEIRKALKEGRRPEPGPPAGDHDLSSSVDKAWEEEESSPEQLSPEKPQVGQPRDSARTISDGGTKPETASQFTGSFQQYSSDKGDPNTVFPAADYRSTAAHGSHGRAPNEFSEYSQSNSSAYSGSYYNMPAAPQDGTSSHINTGYSYSVSAPIHDSSNVPLSYDVPNYQPYPTMHDGSFDSQPTEHTSYPVNASYYPNTTGSHPMAVPYHSNPPISGYQSTAQHTSVAGRNGAYGESTQLEHATSAPAATFSYNSNYQPPPEKIAEAHKAARFAVGALAFDDVPTAVDHLKRSLELLTLPSTSV